MTTYADKLNGALREAGMKVMSPQMVEVLNERSRDEMAQRAGETAEQWEARLDEQVAFAMENIRKEMARGEHLPKSSDN